ncbi:MAG: thiol:disulfide interchange protein, partial [Candidatus Accumulibacter sp.]|nr:thiol:disulfide interchange protein [Accumulibacter sp.]
MIRRIAILFLFFSPFVKAADLLPPRVAFRPTAWAADEKTLEVRFKISEGYYLYRDKFAFRSASDVARLGAPIFSEGRKKFDETFGDVEVYYREILIRIPIDRKSK